MRIIIIIIWSNIRRVKPIRVSLMNDVYYNIIVLYDLLFLKNLLFNKTNLPKLFQFSNFKVLVNYTVI